MIYTEKNTLRETVDRGEAVIPFYTYYLSWLSHTLYLHWHNEIEIIYVERGSVIYTVDTIPVKVSEGQCIIINSGQLHSAHSADNDTCLHHALLFDLNFLSSTGSDFCQSNYIAPLLSGELMLPLVVDEQSKWGSNVINEVKATIEIYNEKEFGWEIGVKASLFKILSIMIREKKLIAKENGTISTLNNKIDTVKKALNYIQNNYAKRIYLEDLAKEANMNTQYFCRFFKANTGKTPVDFINQYRIEQAARLIRTGGKKISDICFDTGFDNFSYFIKKFKEYKNCTPNQYKKQ